MQCRIITESEALRCKWQEVATKWTRCMPHLLDGNYCCITGCQAHILSPCRGRMMSNENESDVTH
jgi:hypothetical protein